MPPCGPLLVHRNRPKEVNFAWAQCSTHATVHVSVDNTFGHRDDDRRVSSDDSGSEHDEGAGQRVELPKRSFRFPANDTDSSPLHDANTSLCGRRFRNQRLSTLVLRSDSKFLILLSWYVVGRWNITMAQALPVAACRLCYSLLVLKSSLLVVSHLLSTSATNFRTHRQYNTRTAGHKSSCKRIQHGGIAFTM